MYASSHRFGEICQRFNQIYGQELNYTHAINLSIHIDKFAILTLLRGRMATFAN